MKLTERQKQHRKFLASTEWADIRVDLFMTRGEECELCHRKHGLQVHHLTYENFGGNEEPEDLIILCSACHMREHGLLPALKKNKRKGRPQHKKKSRKKKTKYDHITLDEYRDIFSVFKHRGYVSAYIYTYGLKRWALLPADNKKKHKREGKKIIKQARRRLFWSKK